MAFATYTLISSQTLSTTATSVTFSSIPSTYNDLKIVCSVRNDYAATFVGLKLAFNSDSATNYSSNTLYTNSSTTASGARVTSSNFDSQMNLNGGSTTANTFGLLDIYFPNYNSTGAKPYSYPSIVETNSTTYPDFLIIDAASLYRGASAITSLSLTVPYGNLVANSSFYLYGIKNS